ncbi:hypothetical protein ACI2LF_43665 [Kribbella sp. NPDC020789]
MAKVNEPKLTANAEKVIAAFHQQAAAGKISRAEAAKRESGIRSALASKFWRKDPRNQ